MTIAGLQRQLSDFARERDWEQFHNPKNLVMALAGEVGELTEIFQWLSPEQAANVMSTEGQASRVRAEIADVFAYLLLLADVLGVDLEAALTAKMIRNAVKYPAKVATRSGAKHRDLPGTGGRT